MRRELTTKEQWDNCLFKLQQQVETWGERDVLPVEKHCLIQLALLFKEKDINIKEVAESLGCSVPNVYQMFTGKMGASLKTLQKYANVAGVSIVVTFKEMVTSSSQVRRINNRDRHRRSAPTFGYSSGTLQRL